MLLYWPLEPPPIYHDEFLHPLPEQNLTKPSCVFSYLPLLLMASIMWNAIITPGKAPSSRRPDILKLSE
ncbi:hypothetical protein H671_3g8699 [Cricetulus griseus]|nr:hypothetical protein H671_3g8699 [Cricetulus griseus]